MRIGILVALVFAWRVFCTEFLAAQDFPQLSATDVSKAKIIKQKTYEGEGLYGYMDGGAELYMAYGFEKLSLQEIEINSEKYTVIIYRMAEPQSAFGIYSIYRFKCDSTIKLTRNECVTAYQYSAQRNKYYYSVINQSGSKAAQQESLNMAKILIGKIYPDSIPWPDLFNMDVLIEYQTSLKYIRGNIALQQVLVDWNQYLGAFKNYSMWYLPIENENSGNIYMAIINFINAADCKAFLKNTALSVQNIGDKNLKKGKLGWMINENSILYLDITGIKESPDPYANAIYLFLTKLGKRR
jgi:hypothetical protein